MRSDFVCRLSQIPPPTSQRHQHTNAPLRVSQCNQGQPCSNCARRFPPPVCEYKPSNRCVQCLMHYHHRGSNEKTSYLPELCKPRRPSAVAIPQWPAFAVTVFPPILRGYEGFDSAIAQHGSLDQHSPLTSPWSHRGSGKMGDSFPPWPGLDVMGQPSTPPSPGQYAWSTDVSSISMCILACQEGCTSHSDEVHDAIRTLRAYRSTPGHWAGGNRTLGSNTWTLAPAALPDADGIAWPLASLSPELPHHPVPQTMQNSELLSICMYPTGPFPDSRACLVC